MESDKVGLYSQEKMDGWVIYWKILDESCSRLEHSGLTMQVMPRFHYIMQHFASLSHLHCIFLRSLLFFVTGLCAISLPRQMAMQNAIKHIQEIIQNKITLFKTEKILTNVNWTLVEEKTRIEYIIPVSRFLAKKKKKNSSFPSWICLSFFSLL